MPKLCPLQPASLLAAVVLLGAATAWSYPFDGRPKVLLHVVQPVTTELCAPASITDCSQAVVQGGLDTPAFVYLLVARGDLPNIAGLECGIDYESGHAVDRLNRKGLDVLSWTLCATLEFPTDPWPAPGGGNLITWSTATACQTAPVAVAGYFYVAAYNPDRLRVTARPVSATAAVSTCATVLRELEAGDLGSVTFGSVSPGCNPCNEPCAPLPTPACELRPAVLDFGQVVVGQAATRSFTLTNHSGGLLAGSVTEDGTNFEIAGSADYSLDDGASASFEVVYHATRTGSESCTIDPGSGCAAIPATAQAVPAIDCLLAPSLIDFGYVPLGLSADRPFTIENRGGEPFTVNLQVCYTWWPDPQFSVVGPKSFTVSPGQTITSTVRYTPNEKLRDAACQVSAGLAGCPMIDLLGTTIPDAGCVVSAETINFGDAGLGGAASRQIVIQNLGGPPISGTLHFTSNPLDQFTLWGSPSYDLDAGQSMSWTLSFRPEVQGPVEGSLSTGCSEVALFGFGQTGYTQTVVLGEKVFHYVPVGSTSTLSFVIINQGPGRLTGRAGESCPDFFVIPPDLIDVGPNEMDTLSVGFTPSNPYQQSCVLYLPGAAPISLTGNTVAVPPYSAQPDFLNFGSVAPGDSLTLEFSLTNSGTQTAGGTISEVCSDFRTDLLQVSLEPGQTKTVHVTFRPASGIEQICDIEFLGRTVVRCLANQPVPVLPVTWSEIKTRY